MRYISIAELRYGCNAIITKSKFNFQSRTITGTPVPVIERRQYLLKPDKVTDYLSLTNAAAQLRNELVPLRLFCLPDTGGLLNLMQHYYFYKDGIGSREEARTNASNNSSWTEYVQSIRPFLVEQHSTLYVEAKLDGVVGMETLKIDMQEEKTVIYEIRTYSLKLGYETVPQFLALYRGGLPSKLTAVGTDPSTQLCSVLYTEVGMLNQVIEIWRHGGGVTAMETSRRAARSASEWRKAINDIATLTTTFNTTICRPTAFSNWK